MKRQNLLIAASTALLLLSACSRVNADNYAKISAGMSRDEVHSILGAPDDASGAGIGALTMTTETWKGSKQTISITFAGDKVALKNLGEKDEK
jgi:shikimate kinase